MLAVQWRYKYVGRYARVVWTKTLFRPVLASDFLETENLWYDIEPSPFKLSIIIVHQFQPIKINSSKLRIKPCFSWKLGCPTNERNCYSSIAMMQPHQHDGSCVFSSNYLTLKSLSIICAAPIGRAFCLTHCSDIIDGFSPCLFSSVSFWFLLLDEPNARSRKYSKKQVAQIHGHFDYSKFVLTFRQW